MLEPNTQATNIYTVKYQNRKLYMLLGNDLETEVLPTEEAIRKIVRRVLKEEGLIKETDEQPSEEICK